MDIYQGAIVILFALAVSDLVVGVSNDAVNFLKSSVGSRFTPRQVIMIIASLGIPAGVTFSSGMMEVARKVNLRAHRDLSAGSQLRPDRRVRRASQ